MPRASRKSSISPSLPQGHGREDRRRGHLDHPHSGRAAPCMAPIMPWSRTGSKQAPMPWRLRWQVATCCSRVHVHRPIWTPHWKPCARPARTSPRRRRRDQGLSQRQRHSAGRCHHRTVSGLSDRPSGPVHGADDQGGRLQPDHRNHLRKPLHARAGAGASRRSDSTLTAVRQPSTASRRCAAHR